MQRPMTTEDSCSFRSLAQVGGSVYGPKELITQT